MSANSHESPALAEINRLILDLDSEHQGYENREIFARKELAAVAAGKADVDAKVKVLLAAADLIKKNLTPSLDLGLPLAAELRPIAQIIPPPPPATQKRARIGTNRYLMLDYLRVFAPSRVEEIANFTGLDPRRIKEQMVADVKAGNVEQATVFVGQPPTPAYTYQLTPAGNELLTRFESYRTANGKPLPTRDITSDAVDDGPDGDDTAAGANDIQPWNYDPERDEFTSGIAAYLKEENDHLSEATPGVGSDAEE
jgi:hypothetical protein